MPTRVESPRVRRERLGTRRLHGIVVLWLCMGFCGVWSPAVAQNGPGKIAVKSKLPQCRRAVVEGTVHAGQGFQVEFARGLVFGLEPIRSGWALRVVAAGKRRGVHDYAEVATLPYQSVSPLLLSTDWAFRAQDAVGWTPRRFRYAATENAFAALAANYDAVLRGDGVASARSAQLAEEQPEGLLEIEDAKLAPGVADQARMAAAVSSRFTETPHTIDGSMPPSPLGRLEDVRFRVSLDLPTGLQPASNVEITTFACPVRPTVAGSSASQGFSKRLSP